MQIKNDTVRSEANTENTAAKTLKKKSEKSSTRTANDSWSAAGVVKAVGLGLLAAPAAAAGRILQSGHSGLALPQAQGRHLLQSNGCVCNLNLDAAGGNWWAETGPGASVVQMAAHSSGNGIVWQDWGSSADVYGMTQVDTVQTPNFNVAAAWSPIDNGEGTQLLLFPQGEQMAGNPSLTTINLHGLPAAQFNVNNTVRVGQQNPGTGIDCTTAAAATHPSALAGSYACPSPPPAPISPPPPAPVVTLPPVVLSSPPPPVVIVAPLPTTTASPTPAVMSPPPPSPTPAVMSPPPPSPTATPTPSPTSVNSNDNVTPAPKPAPKGGGMGMAIAGAAGGVVVAGAAIAGALWYGRRRRANVVAEREANVEMGAPAPAAVSAQPAATANTVAENFEYTL